MPISFGVQNIPVRVLVLQILHENWRVKAFFFSCACDCIFFVSYCFHGFSGFFHENLLHHGFAFRSFSCFIRLCPPTLLFLHIREYPKCANPVVLSVSILSLSSSNSPLFFSSVHFRDPLFVLRFLASCKLHHGPAHPNRFVSLGFILPTGYSMLLGAYLKTRSSNVAILTACAMNASMPWWVDVSSISASSNAPSRSNIWCTDTFPLTQGPFFNLEMQCLHGDCPSLLTPRNYTRHEKSCEFHPSRYCTNYLVPRNDQHNCKTYFWMMKERSSAL